MQNCKKCLLLEAGESVTYSEIMQYVATLDKESLCDENTLKQRLAVCKACDNLLSGMCLKCGCYVEVRARLAASDCPDADNKRW
ncbi:MAG: hypothetical protein IJR60_01850 [Eubacterium sp.]|nr:hypothetical protein [Eubacterium sp.]